YDLTSLVNDPVPSAHPFGCGALFVGGDSVTIPLLRHRQIGVGEQVEGEVQRLAELDVAIHAIRADAQDNAVLSFYFGVCVTEATRVDLSATCEVLGVEVEDDLLAPKARELCGFAFV